MPTERNFKKYHKSIADELIATKDRIRYLIGDNHWQSDGEHKEAILRKVIRAHIAQSLDIGRGFVCGEDKTTTQIDILIVHRNKPLLFHDGETMLVTPDSVAAIIEVKTNLNGNIQQTLEKLADNVQLIREINPKMVAGLFIYETSNSQNMDRKILEKVQAIAQMNKKRVINWIAAGPDLFVRYWDKGSVIHSAVNEAVWHSYELNELSHAYFISNVIWDTCPDIDNKMQYAWFPVEGGKESYRRKYISFNGNHVEDY